MKTDPQRALVVEDEPSWQQILVENLSDAGLVVDSAADLATALALLHANGYRLALVDLSLQGDDPHNEDGLRVLEAVRRTNPACAAILLTGFATVELAVRVLTEYKALSCLRKEAFQRSELRALVRQALASPREGQQTQLRGKEAPRSESREQVPAGPSAGGRALVVEDDAGWRGILQELLREAGFAVRMCASYGEALGELRREHFQLAVLDLSLSEQATRWPVTDQPPDLQGYHLLRATRELGVPTLVVSGVSGPAEIERAYQEGGIFSYVEKQTFNRRVFLRLVDEALRAGRAAQGLGALTGREYEVLRYLGQGKTNKDIAEGLMISENTVKRHIKAVFRKLGIHTRAAAAAKLAGMGEDGDTGY